jgi:hypothetical protein
MPGQICLCICICIRAGIRSSSIHAASAAGWLPNFVELLPKYLAGLTKLGMVSPFFVFLSFLSIKGFYLFGPRDGYTNRPFDRDSILLPEFYLETNPGDMRPAIQRPLDLLWNAIGAEVNPYIP